MRSKICLFVVVFCLSIFSFIANVSRANEYPVLLRAKKTACAYYLTKMGSEFNGRKLTKNLSLEELKSKVDQIDVTKEKLVAVGTPPGFWARKKMKSEIKTLLKDAGYADLGVTMIRKVASLIESKVGVFATYPDGRVVRLSSDIDSVNVRKAIRDGASVMVNGLPIISPNVKKMKTMHSQLSVHESQKITFNSREKLYIKEFAKNPFKGMQNIMYKIRSLFPYTEDFVRPTDGELRSMWQKVTTHTMFSFITFSIKKTALPIMMPMTVINSLNSAGTGTFRSFIGNWFSRDGESMGIRTLKGLMLSSFFTFDLYLAKHLFDGKTLMEMTTAAGWQNFVAASWLTVMFQAIWRTPVLSLIHRWERWKSDEGGAEKSVWARDVAGATEKFMTYVMTQFYMVSILLKEGLFKVAMKDGGLTFFQGAVPENAQLLMNFNIGHAAMGLVGLAAYLLKNKPQILDVAAPGIEKFDKLENALHGKIRVLFRKAKSKKDQSLEDKS